MANFPPSAPEMSDKPPPYEAASRADFPTKEESVPLVAGEYPSQLPGQYYPPPYAPNRDYPPEGGYPPQGSLYPQGQGYPPQGQGYPPQSQGYPPQAQGYPPQGPGYPPHGPGNPPHGPGYQPLPGGHQPQTRAQPTTVIIQQPTSVVYQSFRETPVQTVCQACQASIITGISYETGTFTWLVCAIVCLVGCDAGCCLIPFCVDGCKDAVHVCPNCRRVVGRYNRL